MVDLLVRLGWVTRRSFRVVPPQRCSERTIDAVVSFCMQGARDLRRDDARWLGF